jgi:manganese transport system permease protein
MRKALLMSSLVAAVCGFLSSYLTLKGWALMGDAVSHSVMPGVVVAYALGLPFSLGAFIFGVGSVALIGFIKQKSRVKEDTVIGLVFTGFFALGIVLVSKIKSNIDLHSILFGSPLGISLSDVKQTIFISLLVVILLSIFRKDLMLYCFDPRHAKTVGINVFFSSLFTSHMLIFGSCCGVAVCWNYFGSCNVDYTRGYSIFTYG